MRRSLIVCLWMGGCVNDIGVSQTAKCNGQLEQAEDGAVDSPFDYDGDGYFDASNTACADTYPADRLDCDDRDADVHPSGVEAICNGLDDDCDEATIDDSDDDQDFYTACDDDCDDQNADVNPGAAEVDCNLLDDDCDVDTLDGLDRDEDGYTECEDCADLVVGINPGTVEKTCNDLDDDCDELTSDTPDGDGDGSSFCDDCDDSDSGRYPGFEEVCDDGIDQDCDGTADNDCNYDGTWDLDQSVSYSCAWGLVSLTFDTVVVTDLNPTIKFRAGSSQPGSMVGTIDTYKEFDADNQISGSCTETYSITGVFTDSSNFDAEFTANFAGSCYDCRTQSWTVHGVR